MSESTNITSSTDVSRLEIVLMSTLFPALFILYCMVLKILLKNGTEFRNSYYTLTIGLGLNDMAMLVCTIYSFVYDLLGYPYMGSVFDSLLGFVLFWTFGWYSTQLYILVISINRFVAVTFFDIYRQHASVKSSLICIIIVTLIGFCFSTPMMVICGISYEPQFKVHLVKNFFEPVCFKYFLSTFTPMDKWITYIIAGGACLLYIVSAVYSMYKRNTFTSNSARASYVREIKLLFQGVLLTFTLCTVSVVHWMSPAALINRTVTWLYCSLNPIVYLVLDRQLRKKLTETVSPVRSMFMKSLSFVKSTASFSSNSVNPI